MKTKFNFKSQICTTRKQSERLLALGLKKETADMCYKVATHDWRGHEIPENDRRYSLCGWYDELNIVCGFEQVKTIPAWSLHRLIEMMPTHIHRGEETFIREIRPISISYVPTTYDHHFFLFKEISNTYYDGIIATIEWLIKEGYFNKEYLV